mmetsp:Transcript_49956/g.160583  ORF Transcript_49956/g.160583 Transcript_49956/m.160583 type:complete len:207 (-) Transcript_49956:744-1364(-)
MAASTTNHGAALRTTGPQSTRWCSWKFCRMEKRTPLRGRTRRPTSSARSSTLAAWGSTPPSTLGRCCTASTTSCSRSSTARWRWVPTSLRRRGGKVLTTSHFGCRCCRISSSSIGMPLPASSARRTRGHISSCRGPSVCPRATKAPMKARSELRLASSTSLFCLGPCPRERGMALAAPCRKSFRRTTAACSLQHTTLSSRWRQLMK